jgi:tetratricopeptide (TPR) repeat protein
VSTQHDIMSVCLAVVRGLITTDQARAAILARTTTDPITESLHLDPKIVGEAAQLGKLPEKDREECLELFKELYDSTPASQVLEEDAAFGRTLIDQRIVARPHVDECMELQRRLHGSGCTPLPRLGELLLRKGYLLPAQVELAPTRKMPTTLTGPAHRPSEPVDHQRMPEIVQKALQDPTERFGRYVRVSLLGQGGAGEVWKSWDTVLERWVALKFLKFEDIDELARLKREAQTAARLSHPHIAAVFEIAEANNRTFLVMEFIDGQTLVTYPRNDHRKLVSLMREVSQAIQYAHDQGVVHRDIKPGNIMVDTAGRPYIMDFGLARHVDSAKSVSEYILGTPSYMSPEQARGHSVDARSDVYSLGATLYELLGDRPPFRGSNALDTLEQVVRDEPRPLERIASDLQTIVSKCLMKEAGRRYQRASDVAEDLRRWQEGEAIIAHPPSVLYKLGKKIAKRRAVLLVGLTGGLLAATAAALWIRADRGHSQKEHELTVEKESRAAEARALALARPHLEEGRRARSKLDRLLMTEDASPEAVRALTERAHQEFDRAIEIYPTYPDALLEKARMFNVETDRAKALEYFTRTIAATQGYTRAYLSRARILLDDYEDLRHARGMLSGPDTPEMSAISAKIRGDLKQVDTSSKETAELLFATGATAVLDGDFERAARIFEEYARTSVTTYRGWEWAAHCWTHVPGMAEKAIRDYSEALKVRPRLASLWTSRGEAGVEAAREQGLKGESLRAQAENDFRHALELDPAHADAFAGLAEAALLAGKPAEAMTHFSKAVELTPTSPVAVLARALAKLRTKDNDGAIADADEALRRGSQDPAAKVVRARARCNAGDVGAAQAEIEDVIRKHPRYAPAFVALGDVYRERGNPDRAVTEYGKALALDPRMAEAYHQRGNAERDRGRIEDALQDLSRAAALDPSDPFLFFDRGVCLGNQSAWDLAQVEFRRGLALKPGRADWFWQRLWLMRTKAGEAEQALEELRAYVEGRPEGSAGRLAPKMNDLLLGRLPEADFLALLERTEFSRKAIAEGYFFAAEKALADGRKERAVELFKRCLKTGALTTSGYSTAEIELRSLSGTR